MKLALGSTALALALLAGCSAVPGGKEADEHAAHHPAGAAAAAAAPAPPGYDRQMTAMHEMHRKMADAKTPDERAALMKDHMKTMHDGMAMMGKMGGSMGGGAGMGEGKGPGSMDPAMMKRRMDMLESMMQMMLDRDAMKPSAAK